MIADFDEYPFSGKITRYTSEVDELGDTTDVTLVVYEGKMDYTLNNSEIGNVMQNSTYVVTIPFNFKDNGKLPKKGDIIEIDNFDDELKLTIDNYVPSQLGGITIYASRGDY